MHAPARSRRASRHAPGGCDSRRDMTAPSLRPSPARPSRGARRPQPRRRCGRGAAALWAAARRPAGARASRCCWSGRPTRAPVPAPSTALPGRRAGLARGARDAARAARRRRLSLVAARAGAAAAGAARARRCAGGPRGCRAVTGLRRGRPPRRRVAGPYAAGGRRRAWPSRTRRRLRALAAVGRRAARLLGLLGAGAGALRPAPGSARGLAALPAPGAPARAGRRRRLGRCSPPAPLLVGGPLAAHLPRAAELARATAPGPVGGVALLLLGLRWPRTPSSGGFLAGGPGLRRRRRHAVGPFGHDLGAVPALPLLAALPGRACRPLGRRPRAARCPLRRGRARRPARRCAATVRGRRRRPVVRAGRRAVGSARPAVRRLRGRRASDRGRPASLAGRRSRSPSSSPRRRRARLAAHPDAGLGADGPPGPWASRRGAAGRRGPQPLVARRRSRLALGLRSSSRPRRSRQAWSSLNEPLSCLRKVAAGHDQHRHGSSPTTPRMMPASAPPPFVASPRLARPRPSTPRTIATIPSGSADDRTR